MLRNFIFSFIFLMTTPFIWANDFNHFTKNNITSTNSILNTCTISISSVQGPLNGQTVAYQEIIEPIVINLATDCNETLVLNFAPGQLPAGINYTFANNQLIIGGTIEDETPQEYSWTAEVNNIIPADETNPAVSATTSISLSGSITVTPTVVSDIVGPEMSNFSLSPATIDLSNGAVTVSATVRITDQTGVATPSSNFGGAYITGTPSGNIYFSHWVRVSGDQFDGIYECFKTIEPDQIPEGDYTLRAETTNINDLNGFNANPPAGVTVSVINPTSSDFEGPVMSAFSLSPQIIDLSNGAVTVSATVRITDQTGVATPSSNFGGAYITGTPSGNIYFSHWVRVSGDQFDGIYECFKTIEPDQIPEGDYTLRAETTNINDLNGFNANPPAGVTVSVINPAQGCTYASLNVIAGSLNQNLTQGDAIETISIQLDTDCLDNDNNTALNSSSEGLPNGVTYSFDGVNNIVIVSGTPSSQGTYSYVIEYYNGQTIGSSSVSTTIGGTIAVIPDSTTSTTTANSGNIYFENGTCKCPQASIGDTALIDGITYIVVDDSTLRSEIASGNVNLCTTFVTDMNSLFSNNTSFNDNIGFWDTSNVLGMQLTFGGASSFNQDISKWNTENVGAMNGMFAGASAFNQNIGGWNISNVTDIWEMFQYASSFNQDLSSWNTSNIVSMRSMFEGAIAFNQTLSNWDTSSVIHMGRMFFGATSFNQNIGAWNMINVLNIDNMFNGATVFNQNIGGWNTSNVIGMSGVFDSAESFNHDISSWNTSSVNNMESMFFGAFSFNQDIGNWDTSNVTDMSNMFREATVFNQDLSNWCVEIIPNAPENFSTNAALTQENQPVWGEPCGGNNNTADQDGDGVEDSVDVCPNTPQGQNVDASGCPINNVSCDFTVVNNPFDQSLDFCLGEAITPFEFKLESNCDSSSLSIDVSGLPNGIDYVTSTTDSFTILTFQGTPTTAGFNSAYINISANNFSSSVGGLIFVDGNCGNNGSGSESCDFTVITNPFDQSLDFCLGEAITPFEFKLESNCNSSSLSIDVSGLPNGIDYVTSTTDSFTILTFQGTPTTAGVEITNINISANYFSSTFGGLIFVDVCGNIDSENSTETLQIDLDKDGVEDFFDVCPDTPAGYPVDPFGCSDDQKNNDYLGDDDNDGILNFIDACPDTTTNTPVDPLGCSEEQGGMVEFLSDQDNDGIVDAFDYCPDTAEGDTVDEKGCSEAQLNDITDFDQDGIDNEFDQCPGTPPGQQVDENGCSILDQDKDLDGILDIYDACLDTPPREYVDSVGCSEAQKDYDFDGIPNDIDQCPYSPLGIAVNEKGCSESEEKGKEATKDDDGDGVINIIDRCPDTPAGLQVNLTGCTTEQTQSQVNIDNDLDGISNEFDLCPETQIGVVVNQFGCPINNLDSDFDKVNDDIDLCPDTPVGEEVNEFGCSLAQKEADFDMDGIVNEKDYCQNTPPYLEVNGNGCSEIQILTDADFDGIPNQLDQCPNTTPLTEVDEYGCSFEQRDDDNDGVINALDRCADTATGEKVDPYGCAEIEVNADDDNDGVLNNIDECPNTSSGATVDNKGCPYLPPVIQAQSFEQTENSRDIETDQIRTFLGKVIYQDPNSPTGSKENISLSISDALDGALFTLAQDSIFLIGRTDYEENPKHRFIVVATNDKNQTTNREMLLKVLDIPNTYSKSNFNVQVFDVKSETSGAKVNYTRYLYPNIDKGVGKWKIKKKIVGGNDAHLFEVKSMEEIPGEKGKTADQDQSDFLSFINPPDFETPIDHNRDNIYEVEVVNINTNDGEATQPISVNQTNIIVPENDENAVKFQTVPVNATDDSDGDGVLDILDNSPFVYNPNQEDSDGDGVGDVTDDADHDGVWNPNDICSNTPLDTKVNIEGCPLFYLPTNNFSISSSEKCVGQSEIVLVTLDTSYNYSVNISGQISQTLPFTSETLTINEVPNGTYTICITVDGVNASEFERCYTITVQEPSPLSVYGKVGSSGKTVHYDLAGGDFYTVTHNGKSFQTDQSSINITLTEGINQIRITTGIECQGIFEEEYFNSAAVYYTPNPFESSLSVYVGGNDTNITLELYTTQGRLIKTSEHQLSPSQRVINLNTSDLLPGGYIIKSCGETTIQSELIIKR